MATVWENRKYLLVCTENTGVHVLPVFCIEQVIKGEMSMSDIAGGESLLQTILSEWLAGVLNAPASQGVTGAGDK